MILGRDKHLHAAAFDEIDEAVRQLRGADDVAFNAHYYPAPDGTIIYNLENRERINPASFAGRTVWDFSKRNEDLGWRHVPIGWHPSMHRFERHAPICDVLHFGCPNERRNWVIDALITRGLKVRSLFGVYGEERDWWLARTRLVVNVLYYDGGIFPWLRAAHCWANGVPVLSEASAESPKYAWTRPYLALPDAVLADVSTWKHTEKMGRLGSEDFQSNPMVLPCD